MVAIAAYGGGNGSFVAPRVATGRFDQALGNDGRVGYSSPSITESVWKQGFISFYITISHEKLAMIRI
ncbi:hypothetical protein Rhsp01_19400 [Rhizobium sp. NBRC 114257]|uniref:Uncharacterized protein n=1 Tax=Rhizobium dioscoreae TaxID=2653122 RepID=A0ABQ0Z243_9HYPH|nr:hypothetical protein RsS93_19360 [Rhizobium dioscoreae]GLU80764.1 hypothetical protein Rhsp01_19400 [Rhizobium sp. NBRC 114257]